MNKKTMQVFDYYKRYCEQTGGVPPSVREIVEELGMTTTSQAAFHLSALEDIGWISSVETRGGRRYVITSSRYQVTDPPEPKIQGVRGGLYYWILWKLDNTDGIAVFYVPDMEKIAGINRPAVLKTIKRLVEREDVAAHWTADMLAVAVERSEVGGGL